MRSPKIQFAHSNGFSALCYGHLFDLLKEKGYTIDAIQQFGHGNFPVKKHWKGLVEELLQHLENSGCAQNPVLGLGHSLGAGLMLMAALERPQYFTQLLLIEPVILSARKRKITALLRSLGLIDYVSPAKKSKKRRTHFPDRVAAYDYFKGKKLFQNFDPKCFQNYIDFGLKNATDGGGLELAFSAKIETEIFRNFPTKLSNESLEVPTTMIYSPTGVLDSFDLRWWKSHFKNVDLVAFEDGGHLFPFEKPLATADLLDDLIQQKN